MTIYFSISGVLIVLGIVFLVKAKRSATRKEHTFNMRVALTSFAAALLLFVVWEYTT